MSGTIVCIHGAGGGGWEYAKWDPIFRAAGYRVIANDLVPVAAGALHGGLGFTAGQLDFEPLFNVLLFLFAVVGGITTITGALLGGLLFALLPLVQSEAQELAGLVFAAIAVTALALGKQPNGMAGLLSASRTKREAADAAS